MDQNASLTKALFCTLVDKNDQSKYLCYTQNKSNGINIGLTNALDVWSTDLAECTTTQLRKNVSLKSTEDYVLKIRSACGNGSAFVSAEDGRVVLHLGSAPGDLTVSLPKLSDAEGRTELKDLLFRMADSLAHQGSGGASSSFSPVKSPQKRNAEFEPRQHNKGPSVAVRRRLAGDSLINPGTRRKKPATGVAFDDEDDA